MKKQAKKSTDNTFFDYKKVLWVVMIFLCSLLFAHLTFYMFKFCRSLMNSDSAFIVDYAIEVIKNKTIFPKSWMNTNDFWVYSLIPGIIPLLKIGLSLFKARQISVFIQTVLFLGLIFDLYNNVLKDKAGLKIIILLLLTGISGQVILELFGDGTYGTIIFFIIFEIYLFMRYLKNGKKFFAILYTILLILLSACSFRFPIYIGAPIICCLLYFIYSEKTKKRYIIFLILTLFGVGTGYMCHNMLSNTLLISNGVHYNMLSSAPDVGNSIHTIIWNYLSLVGSTNQNTYSLSIFINNDFITNDSILIIFPFIRFVYGIITCLLPIFLLKKFKQFNVNEKIIYIFSQTVDKPLEIF